MECFRGDTLLLSIKCNQVLHKGDKLKIAVVQYFGDEYHLLKEETVSNETDTVFFDLSAEETAKIEPGLYHLEIELTTIEGYVKTKQTKLKIKEDAIRERN